MKTLALAGCIAAAWLDATAALAQSKDSLVQPPTVASPDKASVAGSLAATAFAPAELARGSFSLPLPITLPDERGAPLAQIVPSYSPEAGISEWGMGWSTSLELKRYRVSGDLDYATDELTSPWGRLRSGDDGSWYPAGFTTLARATRTNDDWTVTLGTGTRFIYREADAVSTPRGIYAWELGEVATLEGERMTFAYDRNPAGRPFLRSVQYGGRTGTPQYEVDFAYDMLAKPFDDFRSGIAQPLDRRVSSVTVKVRDASTGELATRWQYALTYATSPIGPAFYVSSVTKTFRSGDTEPPVQYQYDFGDQQLSGASLDAAPGLDGYLATAGDQGVQPDKAAITDFDNDGLLDVENAATLAQLHQTAAGTWNTEALPPPTGAENPYCRPAPSIYNKPRTLVRMTGDALENQVVSTRLDGSTGYSYLVICDRAGMQKFSARVIGSWQQGPNTRLVDLDRDHKPDLIRVFYGGYQVLANTSTAVNSYAFTARPSGVLSPAVTPLATYVHDFNGDGIPDLIARGSSTVTVWFGTGGMQFATQGRTFTFKTATGSLITALGNYQFTFVDANRDGLTDVLLTQGSAISLATNRGDSFVIVPVPGLANLGWSFGYPVAADLSGHGENEVVLVRSGHAYALPFTRPGTGLLQTADDGKGTVIELAYARAAAAPTLGARPAVLSRMTVRSSGEAPISYDYSYDTPRMHSVGKFLVGYAGVQKSSSLLTEVVSLYHDDDLGGFVLASVSSDSTSGFVRFTTTAYDHLAVHGLPFMRKALERDGVRSLDGTQDAATETSYSTYARAFCPIEVRTTSRHGTLVKTMQLASVSQLDDSLHCLSQSETSIGTHSDPSLDFQHGVDIARNELGQVLTVTTLGDLGPRIEQQVTYDALHRVTDVSAPGRGTTHVDYDPVTGISNRVVAPDGVVTSVTAFDPISDAVLERVEDRGDGVCP